MVPYYLATLYSLTCVVFFVASLSFLHFIIHLFFINCIFLHESKDFLGYFWTPTPSIGSSSVSACQWRKPTGWLGRARTEGAFWSSLLLLHVAVSGRLEQCQRIVLWLVEGGVPKRTSKGGRMRPGSGGVPVGRPCSLWSFLTDLSTDLATSFLPHSSPLDPLSTAEPGPDLSMLSSVPWFNENLSMEEWSQEQWRGAPVSWPFRKLKDVGQEVSLQLASTHSDLQLCAV